MVVLNLTNQNNIKNQVLPYTVSLWTEMLKRKDAWALIPEQKRRACIEGEYDVMIGLAWDIYKKLYKNFFGPEFLPDIEEMME